jgi:hypothetical protein
MKTSTKLIVLALVILFGTTTAYDLALQKEYKNGSYKNPLKDFSMTNYKDFSEVELVNVSGLSVEISQSDSFLVASHENIKGLVHIMRQGPKLVVTFDTVRKGYLSYFKAIVIKCPKIGKLDSKSEFTGSFTSQSLGEITFKGFQGDTLRVKMDQANTLKFGDNKFNYLQVKMNNKSKLSIDKSNQINVADLDIKDKATLTLADIFIDQLKLKVSDSVSLNLSGKSLKLFKNQ